jgi:hypothetical protein
MLFINGKRLIPAPFVGIDRNINFASDGRAISQTYRITLNGTMLPNKGSPLTTGWYTGNSYPPDQSFITEDEKHDALLAKQDLLHEVFSRTGIEFKYLPSGGAPVIAYPRLTSISINPGAWVIKSDYQIVMEAATLSRSGTTEWDMDSSLDASGLFLTSATDNWQITEREDGQGIYEIQRSLSATAGTQYVSTGFAFGVDEPWRNAQRWVLNRISSYPVPTGTYFGLSATGVLYNLVEDETIDRTAGSYSISRRYIYNTNNYVEERNISRVTELNLLADGGPTVERISINGNIRGLDPNNTPSGKLVAAYAYWNSIKNGLGTLVGANGSGLVVNLTEDTKNGVLDYSVDFTNYSGSIFKHTYDVSFAMDQAAPSVTIQGVVEGVTPHGLPGNGNLRLDNAVSGWETIRPNLKDLAFAEATIFGGASYDDNFTNAPVNRSIAFNPANGTVSYTFVFGYIGEDGDSNDYTHDFTVEFNTSNARGSANAGLITSATINGTINGLTTGDLPTGRYANAVSGWFDVRGNLFSYVNTEYSRFAGNTTSLPIASGVVSRSMVFNKPGGSVSYSTSFGTFATPGIGDVAAADVSIDDTLQNDVFAVQPIPGRSIGPIVQNIGTKTEATRTINVALTLFPRSNTDLWRFSDKSTVRGWASGYLATGVSDLGTYGTNWLIAGRTENWDWKNGFFTTNMSVIIIPTGT